MRQAAMPPGVAPAPTQPLHADAGTDGRAPGDIADGRARGHRRAAAADALVVAALLAAVALFVPTVLSAPTVVASDSGIFYSVFHQLAQGRRLYAEVFDHKDPLFYAPHAAAYRALGLAGPMAWEAVLAVALVLGVVLLGGRLGLPPPARAVVAATFVGLHFLPAVYVPLHTSQQGIALLVLALAAALLGRPGLAGGLFGAAVLSKMPLAAMLPAVLLLAALGGRPPATVADAARRGGRALLGATLAAALVLGALVLRGELAGYGDAIRQNLAYPALNVAAATSFRQGATLADKAAHLFTAPMLLAYLGLLAAALGIVGAALVRRPGSRGAPPARPAPDAGGAGAAPLSRDAESVPGMLAPTTRDAHAALLARLAAPEPRAALLALAVALGAGVMLGAASWWSHHFQIAALAFALALAPTLLLLGRLRRPLVLGATLAVGLGLAGLFSTPSLGGSYARQTLGLRPADPCDILARAVRRGPRGRECGLLAESWPAGTRFAVLQQNDPGTLAAWTGPDVSLACRVFYQFPWFMPELFDELVACLERGDVDVVLKPSSTYDVPELHRRTDAVLARDFALARRHGDVEVWERVGRGR